VKRVKNEKYRLKNAYIFR